MEVREAGDQVRYVAARGLHFDRYRNRVSIILHTKNYRQPPVGGGVHRLPEFAFAGSAIAERNVGDFVAMKLNVLELAIIAFRLASGIRVPGEITASLGASHGLQKLGAGAGR